ncbi:MAG: 23S rRNA (adenine(2503)-C(2))-methyltransferase RlmN [Planctomycetes bacterium]|nr:23S rRNA (adenine(2503)-C(2))-methyltransferase RlmN [Planctomycetota bacterium]
MTDAPMRPRLSDLERSELDTLIRQLGQPAFRAGQVWDWMAKKGVFAPREMTNLPAPLRDKLIELHPDPALQFEGDSEARDTTEKLLFRLADGRYVESVLIPAPKRTTVCLSSQVGCAVGCRFCASGIEGGQRNLTTGEIFEQFMAMSRRAEERGRRVSNIVVMGMGEPMFNFSHVMAALDRINSPEGPNLGARKITVSTVGIRGGVERFTALRKPYTLAFSLHAPNDELRRRIVPLASAMSVAEIREAALRHLKETGREVTFEYVLLRGVNDSPAEAREFRALMRGTQASVNLIPYNPVPGLPYERPDDRDVDRFVAILEDGRVKVSVRRRKGSDIDAACGQLALKRRAEER